MENQPRPGEGLAIASIILGLISCILVVVTYILSGRYRLNLWLAIPSGLCGFVGIVLSHIAKRNGNFGSLRIAGTIISWIGAVFSAVLCGMLLSVLSILSHLS